jgi:hypothetical protein
VPWALHSPDVAEVLFGSAALPQPRLRVERRGWSLFGSGPAAAGARQPKGGATSISGTVREA